MLKLKQLREEQGKTQNELAKIFNISRQVYANYENNINQPSPQMLITMADYFQCNVDYLIGRADDFGNVTIVPDYSETERFSAQERTLIKEFRTLSSTYQQLTLDYIKFLSNKDKK